MQGTTSPGSTRRGSSVAAGVVTEGVRVFRWAVAVAAGLTVLLVVPSPAQAAVAVRSHSAVLAESKAAAEREAQAFLARAAARAAASPAAVPVSFSNYIENDGFDLAIGVIQKRDGVYTHGNYDAALSPQWNTYAQFTWSSAAGWWTAPGYCTWQYRSNDAVNWTRQKPDLGPGWHWIGSTTFYALMVYQANTCDT